MKQLRRILFISFLTSLTSVMYCQKADPGQKIKSIVVLEEKSDMLVKKQVKESETYYDEKGNVIEEINYKQGKVDKHFKYHYNSEGNKIKEEEFEPSGKLKESSEYKYENGLRVEKIVYDPDRKIKMKKAYIYTKY